MPVAALIGCHAAGAAAVRAFGHTGYTNSDHIGNTRKTGHKIFNRYKGSV